MLFVVETQNNQGTVTRDKVLCDNFEKAQKRYYALCLQTLRQNAIGTQQFECWIKCLSKKGA